MGFEGREKRKWRTGIEWKGKKKKYIYMVMIPLRRMRIERREGVCRSEKQKSESKRTNGVGSRGSGRLGRGGRVKGGA